MKWSLKMVQLKGTMPTSLLNTSMPKLMVKATPRHCWKRSFDHKADETAIPVSQGTTSSGKPRTTTRGWSLLVRWKDQAEEWIKLKDLKASSPVELAECAERNELLHEPAFKWWAPFTLRRRNRIQRQ